MLVNDKWLSKTAFCLKRNGFSLVPTLLYFVGKVLFPRVGILHSQRGNILFPTWELFVSYKSCNFLLKDSTKKGKT